MDEKCKHSRTRREKEPPHVACLALHARLELAFDRLKNAISNACFVGYVLTDYTAIKFHSHGDPAIPRDWVYPEEASCNAFFQPMPHDDELIVIASEYLNVKEDVN